MRRYLFNTDKLRYVKGEKPQVECILCAIRDNNPEVKNLEICRSESIICTVNLFPFNPGHLMLFPARHVIDPSEMTDQESLEMHHMLVRALDAIRQEFSPAGFNIGYNLGDESGASIAHLHCHLVPRYRNETGFLDVLAGTRVVVADPVEVMERLKKRLA